MFWAEELITVQNGHQTPRPNFDVLNFEFANINKDTDIHTIYTLKIRIYILCNLDAD